MQWEEQNVDTSLSLLCLPQPLGSPQALNPLVLPQDMGLESFRFCIWEERLRKAPLSKLHIRQVNLCPIMMDRILPTSG